MIIGIVIRSIIMYSITKKQKNKQTNDFELRQIFQALLLIILSIDIITLS